MKISVFPSVLEKHNNELKRVFPTLIEGLKIHYGGNSYLVGPLAITEGSAPYKIINSSPSDSDYKVLALASLVLVAQEVSQPINLTIGFPYSTYLMNRDAAVEFLVGKHEVKHEVFAIGKNHTKTVSFEVASVDVIPEIIGCGFSVRNKQNIKGNVFVVNMGYGTFEAGLTNESGIIDRTVISRKGLHYAIDVSMKELNKQFYLGMRTEHQYDLNFQKGYIVLNRKKIDLTEIRKNSLERYYKEIISPSIRNVWTDDDFASTENLILAGGGAYYNELVELFTDEFGSFLNVQVAEEPHTAVARGYCIRSIKKNETDKYAVGIDIGNSQTVIAIADE